MRIISFDGRLGRDAEVHTTKDGKPFIRLQVANNIFTKGEDRTDWFDVTCYDSFIVDKRAKYLTKGTYVIVTGSVTTEVKPSNGKLWINHYVTANTIDMPRFGKSQESSAESEEPPVSVYTANTRSDMAAREIDVPAYEPQISTNLPPSPTGGENGDDLPF